MLSFQEWMSQNKIKLPKKMKANKMNETAALEQKAKSAEILYVGAILTKDSQEHLWHSISKRVAIPADWKRYCHHMTVRFKPTDDGQLPVFGEDVTLVVTEIYADDKGVCVRVEPNTNNRELHMPPDQIPHVTVATAPGVSPVYSNELLRKGSGLKMPQALILAAFLGAKLKRGAIMPERDDAALEDFT